MDTSSRGTTPKAPSTAITPPLDPTMAENIEKHFEKYSTRPELLEHMEEKAGRTVRDAETARAYLENNRWIAKGDKLNREVMFSVLLKISLLPQTSLKSMAGTIRALAFMAETIDIAVADEVAAVMAEAVGPIVDSVVDNQSQLHSVVLQVAQHVSTLRKTVEDTSADATTVVGVLRVQIADLRGRIYATAEDVGIFEHVPRSYYSCDE
ncbi:hypothetical protein C8F04DRAFT_391167 [Mycena alexandri]|uniref:Uncharacterized protein n=1 Tax=Mycena alexandri TaxID=1745969 RepID=A0AAD6RZE6_9AGAR|nr:hypothetical protein C8F04DRAFT_391167 [Mycena alexandri]